MRPRSGVSPTLSRLSGKAATRRCCASRGRSIGSRGRSKCRGTRWSAPPRRYRARCARPSARPRGTSGRWRSSRCRSRGVCTVAPGVVVEQRVTPLERVGCYVPGGRYPLPSSLLMTAIPAKAAGVGEVVVACPRPDAGGDGRSARGRRRAALSRRRRARGGGAGLRHGHDAARGQNRGPGQPLRGRRQGAGRRRLRHRLLRRPDGDRHRRHPRGPRPGLPPTSSRRPSTTPTRAPS